MQHPRDSAKIWSEETSPEDNVSLRETPILGKQRELFEQRRQDTNNSDDSTEIQPSDTIALKLIEERIPKPFASQPHKHLHSPQYVQQVKEWASTDTNMGPAVPDLHNQNPERSILESSTSNAAAATIFQSHTIEHVSPTSENSSIEVNPSAYQLPLDSSTPQNAKLKNKYVMSDGSVVNGKGLGRGRPGIKRGSRKSTLSEEIITVDDNDSATASDPSSKIRQSLASGKRKRSDSNITTENYDDGSDVMSKESTPEYNPTSTQTRSGRQSNKPVPIIVPTSTTVSPASKRPALKQTISSPSIKKHPKIKAKVYRGREQFALCEHCLRGNGPPGNAIVFCDACNKCWHQRCHDPKIPRQVVADTKAEWFCADCDRILHGKKKKIQPPKPTVHVPQMQPESHITTPSPAPAPISNVPPKLTTFGPPITAAGNLTISQQKAYLNSLTKDKLIEIVLKAAALAPLLPIMETPIPVVKPTTHTFVAPPRPIPGQLPYPPPPPPHTQVIQSPTPPASLQPVPQFTSNYTTPVDKAPIFSHSTTSNTSKSNDPNSQPAVNEDEGYFDDFDEHGELYPKPGEGAYNLALPPESGDLGILLEGPECKTFSHWLKSSGVGYKTAIEGAK